MNKICFRYTPPTVKIYRFLLQKPADQQCFKKLSKIINKQIILTSPIYIKF